MINDTCTKFALSLLIYNRTCTGIHYLDETNEWSHRFAAEPGTGQLNPLKNKTYEIVNKVITEVASLFQDDYYHGGGDEPVYNCWNQDEGIRKYLKQHNATGVDLLAMFLQKELDMIHRSKKTAILWEGKSLFLVYKETKGRIINE